MGSVVSTLGDRPKHISERRDFRSIFIAVPFTRAQGQTQSQQSSGDSGRQDEEPQAVSIAQLFEGDGHMLLTWMKPEDTTLSEISQTQWD